MKYLALKRLDVGWNVFPGEVLEDPDNADRLVHRGFIVPVPDEFPGPLSVPPVEDPEVAPGPQDPSTMTSEELVLANTRAELHDLALAAGVVGPETLPNKTAVAEAIVAASIVAPQEGEDLAATVVEGDTPSDQVPVGAPSPVGPDHSSPTQA